MEDELTPFLVGKTKSKDRMGSSITNDPLGNSSLSIASGPDHPSGLEMMDLHAFGDMF